MIPKKTKIAGTVATISVGLLTVSVLDSFGFKIFPDSNIASGIIGLATPLFVLSFWIRVVDVKKLRKFLKKYLHI